MIPTQAQLAAQKMAERLGTSATNESVFLSLYDEGVDIEEVRHKVARARISVLVAPASASNPGDGESLRRQLEGHGLIPEFVGHICADDQTRSGWSVAVLRGTAPPGIGPAPPEFTVVAIMHAYNEADVIDQVIGHLARNGVGVYLIDNWSTDTTLARACSFEGAGLVGYERFPPDGPATSFELRRLLRRTEQLAVELSADWIIHNDADEFRSAPWSGVSLRDALYHVQTEGFSAVDHGYLDFALTDDLFEPGATLEEHLWFEPQRTDDLSRLNCWRRSPGTAIKLAWSGGHTVRFPGRKVFPYNFLVNHFPIRSVEQGRRKIFVERLPRFSAAERRKGWHLQYDHQMTAKMLVRPTNGLVHLDRSFDEEFVLERLTRVGWEPRVVRPTVKLRIARLLRRLGLLDKALSLRRKPADDAAKSS